MPSVFPRPTDFHPSVRGVAAAFAAAGLLAGCASTPPPGAGGVPSLTVHSRVIGKAADYIEVTAAHGSLDYRIESITLVGPDGAETRPDEVRRERLRGGYPGYARPYGSIGIGTGYHGGIGVGLGLAFPLTFGRRPTGPTSHVTRATIKVPDPAAYRAESSRFKIAVHLRHRKDGPKTVMQPAPRP